MSRSITLKKRLLGHEKVVQAFYETKYCWDEGPEENEIKEPLNPLAKIELVDANPSKK